jgi:TolB-like protein
MALCKIIKSSKHAGAFSMKFWLLIILLFTSRLIFSDTVKLKNGQTFENVKTEISSDIVSFMFDGKKREFPKTKLHSIKLKPVIENKQAESTTKADSSNTKKELSLERMRIAESLMNQFDWESEIGEKPKLAVLNFQAGDGVSKAELETAVEVIITTLVKTNLFIVIDSQTIARVKLEQEKYNDDCKYGRKDCTSKLGELLSANRILTGKITKINSTYYVNGSIIDPVNSRIDFAESELADRAENLPNASESFAKKIAGGVIEFSEVSYSTTKIIPNVSYLKKSAMLAGYGQFSYGSDKNNNLQKYKGIGIGVLTLALLTQSWVSYQDYQNEKTKYQTAKDTLLLSSSSQLDVIAFQNEQNSFERLQKAKDTNKVSVAFLGIIYLFNLVDTYFLPLASASKMIGVSKIHFSTSMPSYATASSQKEQIFNLEYIERF